MLKGDTVWVGLGGIVDLDLRVATTLKGLCEVTGVSYNTAKSKSGRNPFIIATQSGIEIMSWRFYQVELVRVKGRGGKRVKRVDNFD